MIRHFLLESLEGKNNDLRKNSKQYRINFSYELLFQVADEDEEYLSENNLCNNDRGINNDKLQTHLDNIEKIITTYSTSKSFT